MLADAKVEKKSAMVRTFDDLFSFPILGFESAPALDLYEKDGRYFIDCALPGYKKGDIRVEANDDSVTITGSYEQRKNEDKAHYHHREVRRGSFSRTIALPQSIDRASITAAFENGMLHVTMRPTQTIQESKTVPISG
jgi:HSP20 family protein